MGRQLNAEGITGEINVLDNGAYGDGRDDTPGFNKTISKAQAYGIADVIVPATTPSDYGLASTIVVPRNQRIKLYGAAIQWLLATGTMFQISTPTDTGWQRGGLFGGKLVGGGGTSLGVQIGHGTDNAQGVALDGTEISGFQDGLVVTSGVGGLAYLMHLIDCRIHNNGRYGVRWTTPNGAEQCSIIGGAIFNNTTANLYVDAGASADVTMLGGSIDGGGVLLADTSFPVLTLLGTHLEWPSGTEYVLVDSQAGKTSGSANINLIGCKLSKSKAAATTLPHVRVSSGSLTIEGGFASAQQLGAALVQLGDSSNKNVQAAIHGLQCYPGASPAAGALLFQLATTGQVNLDWRGNPYSGFSVTPVYSLGSASVIGTIDVDSSATVGPAGLIVPQTNGTAAARILTGTGVPGAGLGANGDYYLRADGAASAHLYFKASGAWTGLV